MSRSFWRWFVRFGVTHARLVPPRLFIFALHRAYDV